ncbi:annexin [Fulvivirga marina]|nr:annexin [Fulvivirga marina]
MARSRDSEPEEDSNLSGKLLDVALVSIAGVGTFLLVRKVVRDIKKKARQKKALNPGNPASDAIQLKMAFENDLWFGWGTNEDLVFQILEDIPDSRHMRKVQQAYRDLYKIDLVADMQAELDSEEFAKALNIINSKPLRLGLNGRIHF